MISRKLMRTDLNLLVALQILLEECNVTRAAERLSVSQPALSKTLQRLREAFEDDLFTRTAHGLVPTPRAEALGRELPAVLATIEGVLGEGDFEPSQFSGEFKLLLPPVVGELLLPDLMADLNHVAPDVRLVTAEITPDFQERLKKAEADFAVYVVDDPSRDIVSEPLPVIEPLCYMRRDHPLADTEMGLAEFLAYPHVRLYLSGLPRQAGSVVDQVLAQKGALRSVVLETTQFASAIGVVVKTQALLVANRGLVNSGLYDGNIVGRALPPELRHVMHGLSRGGRGRMSLIRHTRSLRSAPHQWLRELLLRHLAPEPRDAAADSVA